MRILLILGPFFVAIVGLIFLQTGLFAPDEDVASSPEPELGSALQISQVVDVIARIPQGVKTTPSVVVPTSHAPAIYIPPAPTPVENPEMKALTSEILAGLGVVMPGTQPIAAPTDEMRSLTSVILAGLPSASQATQGQPVNGADALSAAISEAVRAGKSEAEIDALVAIYVDARINQAAVNGQIQVPQAFISTDGRVDSATLLTSLTNSPASQTGAQSNVLTPYALAVTTIGPDGKRYYSIGSGDSLASLAHKFYGNAIMFQALFEANRDKLSSPNMVKVGQRIRIPG